MPRSLFLAATVLLTVTFAHAESLKPADASGLKDNPPAAGRGELVELLNRWYEAGRAAGNLGDVYDNRDRGHSKLAINRFPQVRKIVYTDAEKKRRRDWALMRSVRPMVVVGNSSTSAPPKRGGSNPRSAYTSSAMVRQLHQQYRSNNLYIYPEHLDYDPGRWKQPGYGDLYALNTPYLIISRGSSGSDQPFMRAAFRTLAAFRPDAKKKLEDAGLLMPTLQMILRRSLQGVDSDAAYMTGRAHPTAFGKAALQPMAMVKLANEMTADKLPPLSQLKVLRESESRPMRDVTFRRHLERRNTTPNAIGRVFQGVRPAYKMIVSAADSADPNRKPLRYHWKVLRGDADRIRIEPRDERGEVVELTVPFHNGPMRAPDAPAVPHNRVDIACFADNGDYLSAPALISFFMPPDQRRWVDDAGRLREIGYGVPETMISMGVIKDQARLLTRLTADDQHGRLSRQLIDDPDRLDRLTRLYRSVEPALKAKRQAETARLEAAKAMRTASKNNAPNAGELRKLHRHRLNEMREADKRFQKAMDRPMADGELSRRRFLEQTLEAMIGRPARIAEHTAALLKHSGHVRRTIRRLEHLGVVKQRPDDNLTLTPLRDGPGEPADRLTPYERDMLRHLALALLSRPLQNSIRAETDILIDPRIYYPRNWRDIIHHDPDGEMTGWTRRYPDGKVERYNANGQLLVELNGKGPARRAVPVQYQRKNGKVIVQPREDRIRSQRTR